MFNFNFLRHLRRKPKQPKWSIVIDPGHGGKHPGAVNWMYGHVEDITVMEKDINLAVANFMSQYMTNSIPEVTRRLTRRVDTTVSLSDRCRYANGVRPNDKPADAFISIHTNARPMKGRYGLEIETFHFRGSEEGEELAYCIQDTLFNQSMKFGVPVIDRGVKIGERNGKPFYVLKNTNMPAALVELGFLSDDEEAKLLVNPANQELMAMAIVDGVVQWLESKEE